MGGGALGLPIHFDDLGQSHSLVLTSEILLGIVGRAGSSVVPRDGLNPLQADVVERALSGKVHGRIIPIQIDHGAAHFARPLVGSLGALDRAMEGVRLLIRGRVVPVNSLGGGQSSVHIRLNVWRLHEIID